MHGYAGLKQAAERRDEALTRLMEEAMCGHGNTIAVFYINALSSEGCDTMHYIL